MAGSSLKVETALREASAGSGVGRMTRDVGGGETGCVARDPRLQRRGRTPGQALRQAQCAEVTARTLLPELAPREKAKMCLRSWDPSRGGSYDHTFTLWLPWWLR